MKNPWCLFSDGVVLLLYVAAISFHVCLIIISQNFSIGIFINWLIELWEDRKNSQSNTDASFKGDLE